MNFQTWNPNLERILPCNCRISVVDPDRFAFIINYCNQNNKEHKIKVYDYVKEDLAQEFKINNIMATLNA